MKKFRIIITILIALGTPALITFVITDIITRGSGQGITLPSEIRNKTHDKYGVIIHNHVFRRDLFVYQTAVPGGMKVLNSPLLNKYFPDYFFLHVSTNNFAHWWTPSFLKPGHLMTYQDVIAIPRNGVDPVIFDCASRDFEFHIKKRVRLVTELDALRLRRVLLELNPSIRWIPLNHRKISDTGWHIAIQDSTDTELFLDVVTDPEGRILSMSSGRIDK